MVGSVGEDPYGEALVEGLRADRVDTRFIFRDPMHPTGVAFIIVDDQGENSIVVISGANGCLTPAGVEAASSEIARADAVLLQLETPLDSVMRAARLDTSVEFL
jgi:ribokinase